MLEQYIRNRLKEKPILLMTHIVIGYPSFEASFKIIEAMVRGGVDLMELQIPFSEPIADGPVIMRANQKSLDRGATVSRCLDFAREAALSFQIPFLFMSYYNILHKFGLERFVGEAAERGIKGAIVPDLPPEEGRDYLNAMQTQSLAPIFIFSPTTTAERMQYLASLARGFIYCVARKGVTGLDTQFSNDLTAYLGNCRAASNLPLALGFGVKSGSDVSFLKQKVDIAVIGTQTLRLVDEQGVEAVSDFICNLQ